MIAALYVETGGIYFNHDEVDPWDEKRDARLYPGPYAVVAHPPCQLWVNFAALNYSRWGGEHNRPGNDAGCFACALHDVRTWGGVLEHPGSSNAWAAHGLVKPDPKILGWQNTAPNEWVCEIWQSAYEHKARKRTWLFYCGNSPPAAANWARYAGTHQIGAFDQNKPVLRGSAASATPLAFANFLISLARLSRG